jgi:hypothetical protein
VAYYHSERGYALYYLHPSQQNNDSRAYLVTTYTARQDYLDAYQELLTLWQAHPTTLWALDDMNTALEHLGEFDQPLHGSTIQRADHNDSALSWLQLLVETDPKNSYGQYMLSRIQCDLHNYISCAEHMKAVLYLSTDPDLQSSAYTYLALSEAGEGHYATSRELLFQALQLDDNYHNITAREELSGLH